MDTLAIRVDERVKAVHFTEETISTDLMDGRTINGAALLGIDGFYTHLWHSATLGKSAAVAMVSIGKKIDERPEH